MSRQKLHEFLKMYVRHEVVVVGTSSNPHSYLEQMFTHFRYVSSLSVPPFTVSSLRDRQVSTFLSLIKWLQVSLKIGDMKTKGTCGL